MKQCLFRVEFGIGVLFIAAFASGCVARVTGQLGIEPQISNFPTETATGTTPAAVNPATIAHIDPQTGKIITPASGTSAGQPAQPQIGAGTKPPSQLYETISPIPGGGVTIHLDERFMTPSTATIDSNGKVGLGHQSTVSDSNENK